MRTASVFLGMSALGMGCGGAGLGSGSGAFGEWNDDQGASAASAWNRVKDAPVVRGTDVAVGIAGGKLVGVPLDGSPKWSFAHALAARPVLTGNLVIATGGGSLFAIDAKTGQKVWNAEVAGTLRGAGDDGALTAVTLTDQKGASSLVVIDRQGRIARRWDTDKALGVPAMIAGVVFVPWSSQYVSALDAKTGDEVGRILVREKTSHAWTNGGHLYFGETGMFRLDDKTRFASVNRASHVSVPPRELPGSPVLFASSDSPAAAIMPVNAGARDRIRLYAEPADDSGTLGLAGNRYYGTYFRLAMGFEGGRGQLAWVKTLPADVIGGAAGDASITLCTADGKVSVFDGKRGGLSKELDVGEPLQACIVQVDGFRAPPATSNEPSLAEQLAAALLARDADLATAHRLLLRELAALDDEVATKVLIDLIVDPKTPVPVLTDARVALAARRNGARFMIEALSHHYDYLKDVLTPPPSGPIAQALAQIKDPASPAPLASHLVDPATPDPDLRQVAAALAVVSTDHELAQLKQFLAMYQGTTENEDVESAVVSVAQGILKVGGKDGRALVERSAAQPTNGENVRTRLKGLLEAKGTGTDAAPPAAPPGGTKGGTNGDKPKGAKKAPSSPSAR